jgi:imidazoleglycerol-phosphate dehydratase
MNRKAEIKRKTKETDVAVLLNLDGEGNYAIDTTLPFLDHMLELFALHGNFNLKLSARGDTEVDDHHLVEDIGIVLGSALKKALGDKSGINRYGYASIPMDEALVNTSVDISGRSYLVYNLKLNSKYIKKFELSLIEDFLIAFVNNSCITLHINQQYGRNSHHIIESAFKGLARALSSAISVRSHNQKPPSTKGLIA